MSCSAPRPCSAVGAAPPSSTTRRLRELRVLERGDRVGEAGARGHGRHAGRAGEARHRVGREDGGRLVARVDDADAAALGRDEDRRDVPAAEREDERARRARRAPPRRARRRAPGSSEVFMSAFRLLRSPRAGARARGSRPCPRAVSGSASTNSTSRGHDHLMRRSRQCAMSASLHRRARLRRIAQHHAGHHALDLRRVRHADHARLGHRRVLAQHRLHLRRDRR